MKIALASGKGGTGKTLVATNLAGLDSSTLLVDLDVEEPNCYLFRASEGCETRTVERPVPKIDESKCTKCGRCSEVCEFHSIAVLPSQVMVFDELCHGCGACSILCPERAISEQGHPMGEIVSCDGSAGKLVYGRLRVGEAAATPLIRAVKALVPQDGLTILDCPPGTACSAMESVRGADMCILVTEPTPFGLNDLRLAVEMARTLRVPCSVFINKHGLNGADVEQFCKAHKIPILGTLPFDRAVAEAYSKGQMVLELPRMKPFFEKLRQAILQEVDRSKK